MLDPQALREEGRRFRYERRLISSDEFAAWLERWRLSVDEWSSYLERSLLLERWASELDGAEPVVHVEQAPYEHAEFVDAVCSGFLEREALRFAGDAALACLDADQATGERAVLIERIAAAAAAVRAEAASGRDLEREIAARRLDWTRLEMAVLEVSEREVALEAALCVRADRRPFGEVARDCGVPPKALTVYLEDVDSWLFPALVSAQPGELVGPVEHLNSWLLVAVDARSAPTASDPEVQRRAKALLVERVSEQAMRARVTWREHL